MFKKNILKNYLRSSCENSQIKFNIQSKNLLNVVCIHWFLYHVNTNSFNFCVFYSQVGYNLHDILYFIASI